jgi:hypothetical protein
MAMADMAGVGSVGDGRVARVLTGRGRSSVADPGKRALNFSMRFAVNVAMLARFRSVQMVKSRYIVGLASAVQHRLRRAGKISSEGMFLWPRSLHESRIAALPISNSR